MTKPRTADSSESGRKYDNTRLAESLSPSDKRQYKRILVVDDNTDIAFTLRVGLEATDKTMQVYSYDNRWTPY